MGEIRSAIEELRSETLTDLPDARVEEDFDEVHRAREMIELEELRRLADIDRRRPFERDGHLSTASWLVATYKLSWGAARERVRMARALQEMPKTRQAVDERQVSMSAVRVLVSARDADPQAFAACEHQLVEAARIHCINDLGRVVAYWRQAVQREQALDDDEQVRARRRLHASVTFLGTVRLDGELDPECGETVLSALGAVMDAEARTGGGEVRTPAQRRADALHQVCRGYLDSSQRPAVAGERPHVTLMVDAEVLRDGTGETAELDHVGPVDTETARRLACDASITRVVMAGPSEPLDVGRRTSVIPPGIRRALIVRDRRCRFPSCGRPHRWCDGHHVVHWGHGGPTAVPNLVLLCRRHHRMVHQRGGFTVQMTDGRPVFRRPDGSVLEERAPP
jgi:hypothetical protein